jgi:hypothetical protein
MKEEERGKIKGKSKLPGKTKCKRCKTKKRGLHDFSRFFGQILS